MWRAYIHARKKGTKVIDLSETSFPKNEKAKFDLRLEGVQTIHLGFVVWSARDDPNAEVIVVDVRQQQPQREDNWKTIGRLAVYRTADGKYRRLPERQPPSIP
jgi:hypothetical protein